MFRQQRVVTARRRERRHGGSARLSDSRLSGASFGCATLRPASGNPAPEEPGRRWLVEPTQSKAACEVAMFTEAWKVLKETVLAFIDDEALTRGAAIAFYTVTSI